MSEAGRSMLCKTLIFTAVVEVGTGLVLMIDPAIVVTLLLGADISSVGVAVGRCFGIALFALGLACLPRRQRGESNSSAFQAMLTYNAFVALYLTFLGTIENMAGVLLWPAVALHAVVALLLVWASRDERLTKASNGSRPH